MEFEKLFKIYWKGVYSEIDLFTDSFEIELDNEISFFSKYGLTEITHRLINFKNHKITYSNSPENVQYTKNFKTSLEHLNFTFRQCNTRTKYEMMIDAVETDLIKSNSAMRKRILPIQQNETGVALNSDVDVAFYFNFQLREKFDSDLLQSYKETLDESLAKTAENNRLISEYHNTFSNQISENIKDNSILLDESISSYKDSMLDLERNYHAKLQFDEPSKFWNTKANDYKTLSEGWYKKSIITVIILLVVTVIISMFIFDIEWDAHIITIKMIGFSNDLTFGNVLLIAVIESIIIYILKTCIKYYDYNLKLYEFYKSKEMLSSFYVTIKDDDLSDGIKEKIYTQLFASSSVDFDKVDDIGFNNKLKG